MASKAGSTGGRGTHGTGTRKGEEKLADETRPGDAAQARGATADEEARLIRVLRERAQQYLRLPNVTSVGVGRRIRAGQESDELTIQFTVAQKLPQADLAAEGLTALPTTLTAADGTPVPVDVVERSYKPSYEVLVDPDAPPPPMSDAERARERRRRLDTLTPGVSISHHAGSAGTLGLIVYDRETGEPYALSNWHVLQGPGGRIGDAVVQPGPYDDGDVGRNVSGRLVRGHLGVAGDCAVATIEGRRFGTDILGLGVTPRRAARVNLGDRVVKSGRTTDVTFGVVARVGVVVNINYGGAVGVQQVGGFEVRPDPAKPPPDGEISDGGDSGSAWMVADADGGDVVVGLHFAGETDPEPQAEHALACNIHSVLDKLKVTLIDPRAEAVTDRERWERVNARIDALSERLAAARPTSCSCGARGDGPGAAPGSDPLGPAGAEAGLPVYGNWCGPGHGGGGAPIDELDRSCMDHDNCYGRRGYFDCECDARLIQDIDRATQSGRLGFRGRLMAPIIKRWFQVQPCRNHAGAAGLAGAGARPWPNTAAAAGMVPGVPPSIRDVGTAKSPGGA
ncbi:MAG TPA: hypothetical protein VF796_13305 [Humisphaera sp.]